MWRRSARPSGSRRPKGAAADGARFPKAAGPRGHPADRLHLESEASEEVADRFLDALGATLAELASTPMMGRRLDFESEAAQDVRVWRVSGSFANWLVFYRPFGQGIEVVRVLHGARDIPAELRHTDWS